MKKNKFKRILLIIIGLFIILAGVIASPTIIKGYNTYSTAIKEVSIDDKINEIRMTPGYTTIDQIPEYLKSATIAIEDHRFYDHGGLDIFTTLRAIYANITNDKIVSGGSTITQQLAKNMYFSFEKKYSRKIAELLVTYQLEKELEKDEILELYINTINYGDGFNGIKAASNGYFNKNPNELSSEEAVILAGIPQFPNYYKLSNPDKPIVERIKVVINALIEYRYLESEEGTVLQNRSIEKIKNY